MGRRSAYLAIALIAALPRLGVLLHEREEITAAFTEKSDEFAQTFVASGTYGFIPGEPSAYTQPLYGFFLVPLYELAGRSWISIGLAQIAVAVAVALLVFEIGRRTIGAGAGTVAAVAATLHPYLVWHDVHVNREILDQLAAAAIVLLTLVLAERRRSPAVAAALGVALGVAVLGNSRLLLLPLAVVGYLVWRIGEARRAAATGAVVLAAAAATLAPWVVRNAVVVGCPAITTDSRALWKANNEQTYELLARGEWIDAVRGPPGAPMTPEMAWGNYTANGILVSVDECEQLDLYQELVLDFWREHPGEKARLAVQSTGMFWSPRATRAEGRPGAGTFVDRGRRWVLPAWMLGLYALALLGAAVGPRRLVVPALGLLAYGTLTAIVFVGATRYRAPFDFLLALLAAAGGAFLVERARTRRGST